MAATLEAVGHVVVSRWLRAADGEDLSDRRQAADAAAIDLHDLSGADVLIAATDGPGAAAGGRGGRHVELGFALALGRRVLVVGPPEHVFHHLPAVRCVDTWDEVEPVLAAWAAEGGRSAAAAAR